VNFAVERLPRRLPRKPRTGPGRQWGSLVQSWSRAKTGDTMVRRLPRAMRGVRESHLVSRSVRGRVAMGLLQQGTMLAMLGRGKKLHVPLPLVPRKAMPTKSQTWTLKRLTCPLPCLMRCFGSMASMGGALAPPRVLLHLLGGAGDERLRQIQVKGRHGQAHHQRSSSADQWSRRWWCLQKL